MTTEIDAVGNPPDVAVVGELVTHRLTLEVAAGTLRESVLQEAFATPLAYVDFVGAVLSSPLVRVSGSLAPVVAADGRSLSFGLGTIVNDDLDAATVETITFTYRSVVRNVAAARDAAGVTTVARFTAADRVDPVLAVSPPLRILEPKIDAVAAVVIAGGAASGSVGDGVTYELTIGGNAGSPAAHDVAVSWPLPTAAAGSLVVGPAITVTDTAGIVTAAAFELVGSDAAGWTLRTRPGNGFEVEGEAGRRITVTVAGTVSNTILPGNTTRTAATVTWTSLAGDPGARAADPTARERTGAGGIDSSRIVAVADFRAVDFGLSLDVVATSESTGGGRATIGEVIRHRIVSLVPEGDISAASARVRVELPPGLAFLDDGSTRVALVSNGGLSASRLPAASGTHVAGGAAAGVVPTRVLPAAAVLSDPDGFVDGGDVIFDFGVLANADADANDEFIVLEFNTLVTNGSVNAVRDAVGTELTSTARLIVDGFPLLATATDVVTVAEGMLAWLTSRAVTAGGDLAEAGPFSRGSRVGQQVEFATAGGPERTTLHDLRVTADLPAGATIVPGSVRAFAGQVSVAFGNTSTGSRLDLTIDSVPPGGLIRIMYDVDLAGDLAPGSSLDIPLTVRGSTLPGAVGTPANPTGSTTPGVAGSGTGERDGSGGINTIRLDTTSTLLISAVVPPPPTPPPPGIIVTAAEISARGQPWVNVIDQATGVVRARFLAYEAGFAGGVRVAVGDVDGNGVDDVLTAPGPGRVGEVRVFHQDGTELVGYRTVPFARSYRGGVEIAVGEVTGDGLIDLVAAASRGPGDVRVFTVTPGAADPVANQPIRAFRAFPRNVLGGATVATADIGTFSGGRLVDAGRPDGRMEIMVGSGAGMAPLIVIYDVSAAPAVIQRLRPFVPTLRAGLALAAGRYDADAVDDVIVTSGRRGGSLVEVWSGRQLTTQPALLVRQRAFAELSRLDGAVFAAGIDDDGDGRIDSLLVAEGQGGGNRGVRRIGGGQVAASLATALRGPIRLAASRPRG